jgi:hypothetical protein
MAKHPSSVETTVLEGVTHIELGYPVGAEFDLTDEKWLSVSTRAST